MDAGGKGRLRWWHSIRVSWRWKDQRLLVCWQVWAVEKLETIKPKSEQPSRTCLHLCTDFLSKFRTICRAENLPVAAPESDEDLEHMESKESTSTEPCACPGLQSLPQSSSSGYSRVLRYQYSIDISTLTTVPEPVPGT